ncbi:MAG: radical SAM protein, partial [Planctomycetota bacterium]
MYEALFSEPLKDTKVRCRICPHNCLITPDKTGICRQRKNIEGKLYLLNYARATSIHLDPIEKKPLYHFFPGKNILSLGTNGCNLACLFCQNWTISQEDGETEELTPEQAVALAKQHKSFA